MTGASAECRCPSCAPTADRMRRLLAVAIGAALSATLVGTLATASSGATRTDRTIWQIGTYDYLTNPADYTGLAPLRAVQHGQTLGLGTFDHLDGELVLVGGTYYRVGTDGRPSAVDPDRTTPFFQSIDFQPDRSGPIAPGTTCAQILPAVNALAGTDAGVVAVRVRGTFTDLVTRSVPAQTQPYPPLSQVVAGQTLFPLGTTKAILVGFRTGQDFAGTGAPGLHLHGVTADRSAGGHVISCVAGSDVQLSVERASDVRIVSGSATAN